MAVEAGSENGLFPADETTARLPRRARARRLDAGCLRRATPRSPGGSCVDLDRLAPLVAKPWSPGNVAPLTEVIGTPVDQVYIGNCSNGTITDLRQAASMLRGRKVHPRTRAIVVPATQRIYAQALAEGLLDVFVEAGAMVSTPDLRRVLRRLERDPRRRRGRRRDHEPQLPRPDGRVAPRRSTWRTPTSPPLPRSPARSSTRCRCDDRRAVSSASTATTSTPTCSIPGPFLDIEDPELMKDHLFEGLDPALRDRLGGDTALVVDANFGCGLVARARAAGDEGVGRQVRDRPQLRADLLSQLHQPRPARARAAGAER